VLLAPALVGTIQKEVKVNVFYPTEPHAKQREVLSALDAGERFVLLRAGRKFRKTSLMISWLFEKALETGLTCPYVAPNRVQAKNIAWDDHVQRLLNHFTQQGLTYKKNEVELSIKLPNGGKVQLMGVENQEALRGISNWGAFAGDEVDDWSEDIWPTIIRPNLMVHKAPAVMAGTPKGYRHMYKLEQGGIFKPFHFSSYENPDLDPQELADLVEEYKSQGEGVFRQEILADYEKPEGTVYAEWDMDRRYVSFGYDPNLPLHLSWDFGVNDPTAILWIQPFGSELRLIDYYEASNANLEHFVQVIASKPYRTPALETGDIAGNARELVSGKSPISELARLGHHIRTRHIPNVQAQIRNAHKFIPRLYVSKSNPNTERFVSCILNYKYPKRAETLINQSNEIPVHDEFSHAMRAFEYYCWNITEPKQTIADNPPQNSVLGHLKQKEEERILKNEYVGY
jgi:hypothetical protein